MNDGIRDSTDTVHLGVEPGEHVNRGQVSRRVDFLEGDVKSDGSERGREQYSSFEKVLVWFIGSPQCCCGILLLLVRVSMVAMTCKSAEMTEDGSLVRNNAVLARNNTLDTAVEKRNKAMAIMTEEAAVM